MLTGGPLEEDRNKAEAAEVTRLMVEVKAPLSSSG